MKDEHKHSPPPPPPRSAWCFKKCSFVYSWHVVRPGTKRIELAFSLPLKLKRTNIHSTKTFPGAREVMLFWEVYSRDNVIHKLAGSRFQEKASWRT